MSNPVGRPRNIESPERMWELFEAYVKATKAKPILKHVFVGKDGSSEYEQREKPLTIEGFKNYVRRIEGDITNYLHTDDYPEFTNICRAIKEEIRQDQIEGGMTMIYNPSITQRLNGLTEKTENKNENTNIEIKAEFGVKKDG
jgi:hypothetical protein